MHSEDQESNMNFSWLTGSLLKTNFSIFSKVEEISLRIQLGCKIMVEQLVTNILPNITIIVILTSILTCCQCKMMQIKMKMRHFQDK